MKYEILLFVVKLKNKSIQVTGIDSAYTWVCIDCPDEFQKEKGYEELWKVNQGEAKDLIGDYGDFNISIINKEIEVD